MIFFKENSDITKVTSGIVAHGVNCMGVMGSGVALAIRNRWPGVYDAYIRNCRVSPEQRQNLLGSCQIVRVDEGLWVANCFSQFGYGGDGARYAEPPALRQSLDFVFSHAAALKNTKVHAPLIGAGLGGLDWEHEVLPIFEYLNTYYEVDVIIHII